MLLEKMDRILDESLEVLININRLMAGLKGPSDLPKIILPLNTSEDKEVKLSIAVEDIPDPLPTRREDIKQLLDDLGVEYNTRAAMTTLTNLLQETVDKLKDDDESEERQPEPEASLFPADPKQAAAAGSLDDLFAPAQPAKEPVETARDRLLKPEEVIEKLKAFINDHGDEPVRLVLARFKCEQFSELDPKNYPAVLTALDSWARAQGK